VKKVTGCKYVRIVLKIISLNLLTVRVISFSNSVQSYGHAVLVAVVCELLYLLMSEQRTFDLNLFHIAYIPAVVGIP
jgi:hypothetical protein